MSFEFRKAKRSRRPLKFEFQGVTGSGKTYTAIRLAHQLIREGIAKRFCLLDSENNSGDLYEGITEDGEKWGEYDIAQIPPEKQNPLGYVEAYNTAVELGFDMVIMDSTTHCWKGALKRVDELGAANRGDKFGAGWKTVSPEMEKLVRVLTDERAHLITTSRVKTEWEIITNEKGKKQPIKLGVKADQRDGVEYEFDCVVRFDEDNGAVVDKVRGCPAMHKAFAQKPGPDFWAPLLAWWKGGAELPPLWKRWELKLREAQTLDELKGTWLKVNEDKEKLTKDQLVELEKVKEEMKGRLTPPAAA